MKTMIDMKKIIIMLLMVLIIDINIVSAQTDDQKLLEELGISSDTEQAGYKFPEIAPEASLRLGYRFTDQDDSNTVFEFDDMEDSLVLGGNLKLIRFPHRFQLDLNMNSTKDYLGEIDYAYGEMLLSRWTRSSIFHNSDHITLTDLDPGSGSYEIVKGDGNEDYGVTAGIEKFMIRLKYPDYPAHLYVKGVSADREGDFQQRFNISSTNTRATRNRDIDWNTFTYMIGANSHLGYAEADISHIEKRFEVNSGGVMYDRSSNAAPYLPHNRVPELKGSSNVLKVHSKYNESLVASATLAVKERENSFSGASSDIFSGAGSLQWTPLTRLSFFLNYAHLDIENDNTSVSSITDINGNVTRFPDAVKDALSKTTDTLSITGRYSPEPGVTLKARYIAESIDRDNASDWTLQDSTRKNSLFLTADLRVIKGLHLKGEYINRTADKPSYNTEADSSEEVVTSASWMPAHGVNLLLNYSITKDKRSDLEFAAVSLDRKTRTDNLLGTGTFQIMRNLSLTVGYALMRYKVTQDIMNGSLTDGAVLSEDTAHLYVASVYYKPADKLDITALVSHTESKGEFSPGSDALLEPVSVASFSEQSIKDTVYEIRSDYQCMRDVSCGLDFRYRDVSDVNENIYDSNEDGKGYIFLLSLKKKWG